MTQQPALDKITQYGVVPIIAIESGEAAIPLADALIEGGLPIAEITFRTPAAADAIEKLATERPELLVGAGTVLTVEHLEAAKARGAEFAVAPGLNPAIVTRAKAIGLPFFPGVATPTDIEHAMSLGCGLLKIFPSEVLGGVALVRALAGPYGHTGVRFLPTGGVNGDNLEAYLSQPTVAAVGGTWVAKRDDLTLGRWAEIRARCEAVGRIVAKVRER